MFKAGKSPTTLLLVSIVLLMALSISACGKKGPLSLPEQQQNQE